jgi:hypothetical protein
MELHSTFPWATWISTTFDQFGKIPLSMSVADREEPRRRRDTAHHWTDLPGASSPNFELERWVNAFRTRGGASLNLIRGLKSHPAAGK